VTFDAPPKAAISNDVNLTEMMLALGLTDRMVGYTGVSGWKTLDPVLREGVKELPELSAQYPSREVLIGAGADFFFAGWNYEPLRVCRRLQLLSRMEHHEQDNEQVFP
jgi:iron complex transport system substrate-binding protein